MSPETIHAINKERSSAGPDKASYHPDHNEDAGAYDRAKTYIKGIEYARDRFSSIE